MHLCIISRDYFSFNLYSGFFQPYLGKEEQTYAPLTFAQAFSRPQSIDIIEKLSANEPVIAPVPHRASVPQTLSENESPAISEPTHANGQPPASNLNTIAQYPEKSVP